jgi:hypothetical protein
MSGIWVSKIVSSSYGDIEVSVRLDTAIEPGDMLDRLEKEWDVLDKKMDKVLQKLERLNDKTPQKIVDSVMKELMEIDNLQKHNRKEWNRWFEVWEPK